MLGRQGLAFSGFCQQHFIFCVGWSYHHGCDTMTFCMSTTAAKLYSGFTVRTPQSAVLMRYAQTKARGGAGHRHKRAPTLNFVRVRPGWGCAAGARQCLKEQGSRQPLTWRCAQVSNPDSNDSSVSHGPTHRRRVCSTPLGLTFFALMVCYEDQDEASPEILPGGEYPAAHLVVVKARLHPFGLVLMCQLVLMCRRGKKSLPDVHFSSYC
eukprot:1875388-Amphidinium_carterae.1